MTLGEKQRLFAKLIAEFVLWVYEQGYELTYGDALRDPRSHGPVGESKAYGAAYSNHKSRLAVDFNLFKDGVFLQKTSDHEPLGVKWESMHESNCWGGRFNDGNHYSMEHEGRK